MPKWTPEQDALIASNASLGAAEVAKAILREQGVRHTEAAVVKRASRLGVTLTRYEVCPMCGARAKRLHYKGMCRECFVRQMIDAEKINAKGLRKELGRKPQTAAKEKELRALRKRNERKAKR